MNLTAAAGIHFSHFKTKLLSHNFLCLILGVFYHGTRFISILKYIVLSGVRSWFILMMISGHLLFCFMLFYFLFYIHGDLRTFTLLLYVVFFSLFILMMISGHLLYSFMLFYFLCLMVISGHLLYCFTLFYFLFYINGDLKTFTLLFYVVLFLEITINIKQHKTVKKMS